MYNVILDKELYTAGRAFAATFQPPQLELDENAADLLSLLAVRAATNCNNYERHVRNQVGHGHTMRLAIAGVTQLTVAFEYCKPHFGVAVLKQHVPAVKIKPEQKQFADAYDNLLFLMSRYVDVLLEKHADGELNQSILRDNRQMRLLYAKHVSDLALELTEPSHNSYRHPEGKNWRKIRARVMRNLAALLTESAKSDERAAKAN